MREKDNKQISSKSTGGGKGDKLDRVGGDLGMLFYKGDQESPL